LLLASSVRADDEPRSLGRIDGVDVTTFAYGSYRCFMGHKREGGYADSIGISCVEHRP